MQNISRDQLKKLFKKVKHLHLPKDLEEVDFTPLTYYSWLDQSDQALFMVFSYKGLLSGLRLEVVTPPLGALRLGFCEFCHKHRRQAEVFFIATETKRLPKGVEYRTRGTWICSDYKICNRDLKNDIKISDFFYRILEDL